MNLPSLLALSRAGLALAAVSGATLVTSGARAQSLDAIGTDVLDCRGPNCKSLELKGKVNAHGSVSNPWVGLFVGGGKCLRMEVIAQSTDLAMTVVAPNGLVFTDDDSGTCLHCPRVVVSNLTAAGAYTVVINSFTGAATEASFVLRVARYKPSANPNCARPTTAAARTAIEKRALRASGKE